MLGGDGDAQALHGGEAGAAIARDVGRLPESEQHAVAAAIVRREQGVMALSTLVVFAAREPH